MGRERENHGQRRIEGSGREERVVRGFCRGLPRWHRGAKIRYAESELSLGRPGRVSAGISRRLLLNENEKVLRHDRTRCWHPGASPRISIIGTVVAGTRAERHRGAALIVSVTQVRKQGETASRAA